MPTTATPLGGITAPTDADPVENGAAQMRSLAAQLDRVNKIKAADTVKTNSAVLSDVTDMSWPVVAGVKYDFRYVLFMTSTGLGADASLAMNFPGGGASNCSWGVSALDPAATSSIAPARMPAATNIASDGVLSIGVVTATTMVIIEGTLIAGATGTAKLRLAQATATAGVDTLIKAGSKMSVELAA